MNRGYGAALLVSLLLGMFESGVLANEPDSGLEGVTPPFERTEQREPCSDYEPMRRPFFGDLHVHTALSFDASAQDTRNTPADAYAFARGGSMRIQPYDEAGRGLREIRLDRPLDFARGVDTAIGCRDHVVPDIRAGASERLNPLQSANRIELSHEAVNVPNRVALHHARSRVKIGDHDE